MNKQILRLLADKTKTEKISMKKGILLSSALLFLYCKSYDLNPKGRSVQIFPAKSSLYKSINNPNQERNSIFSKCVSLDRVYSIGGATDGERENDIRNQAAEMGANLIFELKNDSSEGVMYRCDDLDAIIATQREIDLKKKKEQDEIEAREKAIRDKEESAEKARKEKELYSKAHHWLFCAPTGYSNLPPSITQEMLSQFKLEAFDSKDECDNTAFFKNRLAMQMGIGCICKYITISRKKAEALNGR